MELRSPAFAVAPATGCGRSDIASQLDSMRALFTVDTLENGYSAVLVEQAQSGLVRLVNKLPADPDCEFGTREEIS